jgi:S1-C subfamily serine protease
MKRRQANRFLGVTLAIMANFALLTPPVALAAAGLSDAERQELEIELEEARAQLDEAAERMGELHSRLYAMETVGHHGQKPMLGVLVGERGPNGGLLLSGVTPGGGAEAAGMQAGDEITSVNDVDLTDADSAMKRLKEAMSGVRAGETVSVGYQRDGSFQLGDVTTQAKGVFIMGMTGAPAVEVDPEALQEMAISITEQFTASREWVSALESLENLESLEELQALSVLENLEALGELESLSAIAPQVHKAIRVAGPGGLRLESISGDLASYFGVESGVLVMAAPAGPDGEPGPLRAGDVLLAIDGEPIRNPGDGFRSLMAGQHAADGGSTELTVEVMRQGVRELVVLTPSQIGGDASSISIRSSTPGELDVHVVSPAVPTPPGP